MSRPKGTIVAMIMSILCLVGLAAAVGAGDGIPEPPVAEMIPETLTTDRVDNYFWLNQKDSPQVMDYLNAENNYTDAIMAHTQTLQQTLLDEIMERTPQDDVSVPYLYNNQYYYRRMEEGKDYPLYCRTLDAGTPITSIEDVSAEDEQCIDVNDYAQNGTYYDMATPQYSGNDVAACAVDTEGQGVFNIFFLDMSSGSPSSDTYPEAIEGVTSPTQVDSRGLVWAEDNQTLFYMKPDPDTTRWYQIWRHTLGTDPATDVLVYEETDTAWDCFPDKTKSNRFLLIKCLQSLDQIEYQYLDATNPTEEFTVFYPRQSDLEVFNGYDIKDAGDFWYILTNYQAENFRMMKAPMNDTTAWTEIVPARNDTLLVGFDVFVNHLVVFERLEGLRRISILPMDESSEEEAHYVEFDEAAYAVYPNDNYQFNTTVLRYRYESFSTPNSVFDYDMATREKTLLKQVEVGGDFSSDNYISERLFATAIDGSRIPVALVYHKDTDPKNNNPLLQFGYGATGWSRDALFDLPLLSLLDRGFIYAIANVRGGALYLYYFYWPSLAWSVRIESNVPHI